MHGSAGGQRKSAPHGVTRRRPTLHGDPVERDPERVLWDVIEERVSPQRALEVYGVVLDADRRTIDWQATQTLRQQMRHGR